MSRIYSKSANIYIFIILIFGCISPKVFATEFQIYTISDTLYLDANGQVDVNLNNYLNAFQSLNTDIVSIESDDVIDLNCVNTSESIDVSLVSTSETLDGILTLTVLDTIAPEIHLLNHTTLYLNADGEASVVWENLNDNSSDNCSYVVETQPEVFTCDFTGVQRVLVTLTDLFGNETQDSVNLTVIDNISPVIVLNEITAYLDENGYATVSVQDIDGGSYDNCNSNFTYTLSDSVFSYANLGMNSVSFGISNSQGETATVNTTIEVKDTLPPVIQSQDLTLYLNNDGELIVTASMFNNGTTDNSLIYSLSINDAFFTCNDIGFNNLILTATDNHNNASSVPVVLEVKDHIDPVAITEDVVLALDAFGQATLTPDLVDNGSYDNCSISKTVSNSDFNCTDIGTHTVFLNVTDASGNFNTAVSQVTIVDNIPPVAITQTYSLELNSTGEAILEAENLDNGSYDNCSDIDEFTVSQTNFNCDHLGQNTVVFSVSDIYGNTSTIHTSVNVIDHTPPTVVLQDIVANLDSNGHYVLNALDIDAGSVDNCSDTLIYTYSDSLLTSIDLGDNIIDVYITDEHGNTSTDAVVITVEDHMDPKLNHSIPDQIAYSESNFCGAFVFYPTPDFEDNSGDFNVTYSHVNGSFFGLGNTTVLYTATDGSGNFTTDSFTVAVLDNTPPVIINAINNYTYTEEGVVTWDSNQFVFSDNCSDSLTVTLSHHSLDTFPIGTTVVTGVLTDEFNNFTTFTFNIVVEDIVDPVFTQMPDDIQVYLSEDDGCEVAVSYSEAIATDNHSSANITYSLASGSMLQVGNHQVNVTATDASGNSTVETFTISVIDTVPPIFVDVPATIYAGLCDNNISYQEPVAEDNCTIASIYRISGLASGSIFPTGIHQIVYRATDIYGNVTDVSFEINIQYIEPPYIPSVRMGCTGFEPFDLVEEVDNILFFGDGVESKQFNPSAVESGIYTVGWLWEDSFGCKTDGTIEVIINETPPEPEIVQPDMFKLSVHNAYNTYQWYKNGVLIEGATYQSLEIFDGGNYEVIVGNESGCTSLSPIYNIGGGTFPSLDIEELQTSGIVVVPNPASEYVIVTTKASIESTSIDLYNLLGQKQRITQTEQLNNNQIKINVSQFNSGVYELVVPTINGKITKKIIIH